MKVFSVINYIKKKSIHSSNERRKKNFLKSDDKRAFSPRKTSILNVSKRFIKTDDPERMKPQGEKTYRI
jgi:hypothetical protein